MDLEIVKMKLLFIFLGPRYLYLSVDWWSIDSIYYLTLQVLFQEYIQDGIDWAKVDFEDNQDCLNLFEKVERSLMHWLNVLTTQLLYC